MPGHSTLRLYSRFDRLQIQEGSANALDYSRFAVDPLDVGHGQLVHTRWVHSHSSRLGRSCSFDSPYPRTKSGTLSAARVSGSLKSNIAVPNSGGKTS
jgi:hypothetical protein